MDDFAFLGKLFGQTPLSQVWVGWHDGSGGFPGGPADRYVKRLPGSAGHYFCIGSLKPGRVTRKLPDIDLVHALVLDDIGTKADAVAAKQIVDKFGRPSWIIETSAGNYQYGWIYDRALGRNDWLMHRAIVGWCHREWGTDMAGADPNRVVRLPSGVNTKPGRGGFAARYTGGDWDNRVVLGDLAMLLGLDGLPETELRLLGGKAPIKDLGDLSSVSIADADCDVWVSALVELGLALGDKPNGFIEIECPWVSGHTDAGREGTAYLGAGLFKCQHDHCSGRKTADFKREIEARLVATGSSLMGLLVEMGSDAEKALEDEYVATKAVDHAFEPPPGGWPAGPGGGGGSRSKAAWTEAEAVDRLIYVQSIEQFVDEETGAYLTQKQLDEALWSEADGEVGVRRGQKALTNRILVRSDLRRVWHTVYRPGLGKFLKDPHRGGLPALNTWKAPGLVATRPGGKWLQVILGHIEGRLFGGDAAEAGVWLDWSAALVQRPAEKINWMPLVVGAGGTGKDLLFKLYGKLVGVENLFIVGSTGMQDRATLADAVRHHVIMVEELLGTGRVDLANVLKALIAAPPDTITVRSNYRGPEAVAKVANLVAYTNNMDALSLGTEDERRRYFIYESKAVALTRVEAEELALAVEQGAGEFLGFLLDRDLSQWSPYAKPVTATATAAANRMMVASMSGSAQKLLEIIEEGELAGRDLVLSTELAGAVASARIPVREAAHAIPEAMKKAGFAKWADGSKQLSMPGGSRPRVWVKKTVPKEVHDWDVAKMRAAVEAEQAARTKDLFDDKVVPFKKAEKEP